MAHRIETCTECKKPIIRAVTATGKAVVADSEATLAGSWRLTERPGLLALAATPTAKLAFGVRLYPTHVCAGARWRRK